MKSQQSIAGLKIRVADRLLPTLACSLLLAGNAGGHEGYPGFEVFAGGAGDDYLEGTRYHNHMSGGAGDDTLYGWGDLDRLDGGSGDDYLHGGHGDDRMDGGDGDDRLDGGLGADFMNGGDGNDRLDGGPGDDVLDGGYDMGSDDLLGGSGDDFLEGNNGDDRLWGGDGDDALWGGGGNDRLWGGDGDDSLIGERGLYQPGAPPSIPGNDVLTGGYGKDDFTFFMGSEGNHTITDFELEVSRCGRDGNEIHQRTDSDRISFLGGRFLDLTIKDGKDGAVITVPDGLMSITLLGVKAADLTEAHFEFMPSGND